MFSNRRKSTPAVRNSETMLRIRSGIDLPLLKVRRIMSMNAGILNRPSISKRNKNVNGMIKPNWSLTKNAQNRDEHNSPT